MNCWRVGSAVVVAAIGVATWRLRADLDERTKPPSDPAADRAAAASPPPAQARGLPEAGPDATPAPPPDAAAWIARMHSGQDYPHRCFRKAFEADPAAAAEEIARRWTGLTLEQKRDLLGEARLELTMREPRLAVLRLFDLAAADADPGLRSFAADLLEVEFLVGAGPDDWRAFRASTAGLAIDDLRLAGARFFADRLRALDPESSGAGALPSWEVRVGPAWSRLPEAGLFDLCEEWIAGGSPAGIRLSLEWLGQFRADESLLRRSVVPFLSNAEARPAALAALARSSPDWAVDLVTPHLADSDPDTVHLAATCLERAGDPGAVPEIILALKALPPEHANRISREVLSSLCDLPRNETHDAAWWEAWWAENGSRLEKRAR